MKYTTLIIVLLLFVSCQNKQKIAERYYNENRKELADKCKLEFPTIPIEIIKGDTIYKEREVLVKGDSIECPTPTPGKPNPFVKCPDVKVKETTKYVTDTIRVKDMAEVYSYEVTIKEQSDKIKKLEKDSQYKWMFFALALLVSLYIIYKVKTTNRN